jgi:hypothetical protein
MQHRESAVYNLGFLPTTRYLFATSPCKQQRFVSTALVSLHANALHALHCMPMLFWIPIEQFTGAHLLQNYQNPF